MADQIQITVMLASDHADTKEVLSQALQDAGVRTLDTGRLKRDCELETFGFLKISLAASKKNSLDGGICYFRLIEKEGDYD